MAILPKIKTNKIMRYVPHPIADITYHLTTPTDIGVIIRANDKVFWARNSSNPTMEDLFFFEILSMRMYGCTKYEVKHVCIYNLKINFMSIYIQIKINIMMVNCINRRTEIRFRRRR